MNVVIIAIDGPAASGKTTVASKLADKLGYGMLDSGSMYRAVALLVVEGGVNPEDENEVVKEAEKVAGNIRFISQADGGLKLLLGDRDITMDIRSEQVNEAVSPVSKLAGVRSIMVDSQKKLAHGDTVVEGRDIGTVVFPDAEAKFYIDATIEERAERRYLEEKQKGSGRSYETVKAEIARRDEIDSSRDTSPLTRANDAVYIDTTGKGIEEVVSEISGYLKAAD